MQRSAGIREVKARLSHFIDTARSEGDVVITDRGKPVARLSGIAAPSGATAADLFARLAEDGSIEPPSARKRRHPAPVAAARDVSVAKLVRDMRR